MENSYEQDTRPTRRGFLDWIIAFGSTVTAAAMTLPALLYLWPAARGGESKSVEVPGAQGMTPGQSTTVQVGSKVVIVVRGRSGYKAFSAACTHLGCLVKWDSQRKSFLCPCHAAVFNENGEVIAGPPPAPLPAYQVRELDGKVVVSEA